MAKTGSMAVPVLPASLHRRATDLGGWQSLLTATLLPGHVQSSSALAIGELGVSRLLGGGAIAFLSVAPQEITHLREHMPRDMQDGLLIHIVLEGSGEIEQGGTRFTFGPGDVSFRSLATPSRVRFVAPARFIALRVPHERFAAHLGWQSLPEARLSRHDTRVARVVHTFVEQLIPCFFTATFEPVAALEQSLLLLLATAYCTSERVPRLLPARVPTGERRWQSLLAHIDAHLTEADLSPDTCAQALGVSSRAVYALFAERRLRFSRYVLDKRLELSRTQLEDMRLTRYSIASLAYRSGFADAAHFSRVFTHRYGMPPGSWRRLSRTGT
jgi:AraC family transcriptional regulator, positive regulator of tynA and feaB